MKLNGFDCIQCRRQYAEEGDESPCEARGGECPKGIIELFPENLQVWELFWDVELLGWDAAEKFHRIELSAYEADIFFEKLKTLKSMLAEWRRMQQEQMEKEHGASRRTT